MEKEQIMWANIDIQSQTLGEILNRHYELLINLKGEIKIDFYGVRIKLEDKDDCFKLTKQKDVVDELCYVIKENVDDNTKQVIKELKKAKKAIIKEAVCDWTYIETCTGDLAREMFVIEKEMGENIKIDPQEVARIEKYIYETTFKNGICNEKQNAVYKE